MGVEIIIVRTHGQVPRTQACIYSGGATWSPVPEAHDNDNGLKKKKSKALAALIATQYGVV